MTCKCCVGCKYSSKVQEIHRQPFQEGTYDNGGT